MSQGSNRLVWILALALVSALMTIAFLLGRGMTASSVASMNVVSEESAALVADYFAKVDRIQAGPSGVSADAFAQEIAMQAAQGKADGFDELLIDLGRMEAELTRLSPPPSCEEFHRLTVSALADAKLLLTDLRQAFGSGDMSKIPLIATRATAAQEKAKKLEEMRRALEIRHSVH